MRIYLECVLIQQIKWQYFCIKMHRWANDWVGRKCL